MEKKTQAEKLAQVEADYIKGKRKKQKIILLGVLLCILIAVGYYFLSTGLNDGRVVKLNGEVANLQSTIATKDVEIANLTAAVADTTVKEVVPETSLQRIGGSIVPEFWFIEGDFIAPNKLEIPTTFEDVNNTNVQIGSRFKFMPSDSWLVNVQGATVEFSHPAKIWGKIKALGHKDRVLEGDMRPIVQKYFKGYPATTITYRTLFIEDTVVGCMGRAPISIKEKTGKKKEMMLNVGFAQRGDHTITFMFLNDMSAKDIAQELIDLLLKSGTYGDSSKLKLE